MAMVLEAVEQARAQRLLMFCRPREQASSPRAFGLLVARSPLVARRDDGGASATLPAEGFLVAPPVAVLALARFHQLLCFGGISVACIFGRGQRGGVRPVRGSQGSGSARSSLSPAAPSSRRGWPRSSKEHAGVVWKPRPLLGPRSGDATGRQPARARASPPSPPGAAPGPRERPWRAMGAGPSSGRRTAPWENGAQAFFVVGKLQNSWAGRACRRAGGWGAWDASKRRQTRYSAERDWRGRRPSPPFMAFPPCLSRRNRETQSLG